jgi:uncharacterized SAM-binding protein YcdF (DUF218 family)
MKVLVDPVVWAWLAIIAAGVSRVTRQHKRLGWALLAFALVGCMTEATNFSAYLLASLERPYLFDKSNPVPTADAVLVLGGYGIAFPQSANGLEFNEASDRVFTGITLVRENKTAVMVVSGGGIGNPPQPQEGKAAKAWIDSLKVLPAPVEVLPACRNTYDEALKMKDLAQSKGWKNIILVTSAWHMRRASATFRKAGLEVIPVGCDYQGHAGLQRPRRCWVPRTQSLFWFKLWAEESVGYVVYRLQGRI